MTTAMRERKGNKLKIAAAGLLSAGVIGGGALAYEATATQPVSANQPDIGQPAATAPNQGGQDALITSATNFYLGQQSAQSSVGYLPSQIFDIQNDGLNARARVGNGDSGSVVYLHYTTPQAKGVEGKWSVVYGGQTLPPQLVLDNYNMPDSWSQATTW